MLKETLTIGNCPVSIRFNEPSKQIKEDDICSGIFQSQNNLFPSASKEIIHEGFTLEVVIHDASNEVIHNFNLPLQGPFGLSTEVPVESHTMTLRTVTHYKIQRHLDVRKYSELYTTASLRIRKSEFFSGVMNEKEISIIRECGGATELSCYPVRITDGKFPISFKVDPQPTNHENESGIASQSTTNL